MVKLFDNGHALTPIARPLDRDKLFMLSRGTAADAAQLALFQLQMLSPEECMAGAAVLFAVLAKRCGIDPQELHEMGRRVLMAPTDGDVPATNSLEALRDFAGLRLMGDNVTWQ
jgi:hypothetical protein